MASRLEAMGSRLEAMRRLEAIARLEAMASRLEAIASIGDLNTPGNLYSFRICRQTIRFAFPWSGQVVSRRRKPIGPGNEPWPKSLRVRGRVVLAQ